MALHLTGIAKARIIRIMQNYRKVDPEQFAEVFGALSNPHRLRIFLRLASCCKPGIACSTDAGMRSCVGNIGEGMGIAPSTLSHHIKELRRAGLIRMERSGRRVECWVDPQTLRDLSEFFSRAIEEELPEAE